MKYRRFGKTEIQIPVISCGGMRYQQSWKDSDPISTESQQTVEACIRRSVELGINHIETARGYGTSEEQLGKVFPLFPREDLIIQTKVGPNEDVKKFEETFEKSMRLLQLDYVDLFAFHGINGPKEHDDTLRCLETAQRWKKEGRVRHIGFSTHGHRDDILKALKLGVFDYVNLHWYYIFQDNGPCIEEATRQDMGVFIISPNDKGGMLYKPTEKLVGLCAPLHPMVFNGLFCLSHPEVHTLSCGVARPEDFDIHLETVEKLDHAKEALAPVLTRLEVAMAEAVGEEWAKSWQSGLPEWDTTPGEINVPVILRLHNLAKAYGMVEYGKMRYNLLGNGDSWFPGEKAAQVDDATLSVALNRSPFAAAIPEKLRETHQMLVGEEKKRLQTDE